MFAKIKGVKVHCILPIIMLWALSCPPFPHRTNTPIPNPHAHAVINADAAHAARTLNFYGL